MAEFLVDRLLSTLADEVISRLQEEFNLVTGVKDEVINLSRKLEIIRRMMQDVQRRKLTEKPVGIWLEKLKDVAYDVDDVLDEWNTEVQKLKIKAEEDPQLQTKRCKVCSFLLSICSCFKQASVRRHIAQKIKELNGRMNMVFNDADEFKFDLTNLGSTSEDFKRVSTSSVFNESEVYGRESAKDAITTELLPGSDQTDDSIRIVSILGTGGVGKTTLAQLVYNDNRVKDHFQIKQWLCVSDPFEQKRIAKAILRESSPDMFELETLLQRVKESISGKKFLLVLDDVWTEDNNKWKPIRDSLGDGAPGSRILVTTRSERVSRMMGTNYVHRLDQLSDSDCWKIISRIAFLGRSENETEKFIGIGLEISNKCKGLPLAANFLGSLLQSKDTVEQWKNVLKSEIWELEEATIGLFPHIYLSYNELSPEVKRCFLYCAVFPKDSVIDVRDLIRRWMAQGYLSSNSSCTGRRAGDLESKGYEYFSSLAMRSFFQNCKRTKDGKIYNCKMHDIVHDFARHLTNGECLIIENLDEAEKLSQENVRHLAWLHKGDVALNSMVSNVRQLRSFYSICWHARDPLDIFDCLKCVRALSLHRYNVEKVPKAIGNLIHLRYLNMSNTSLRILPEEICELYNLETLIVNLCLKLAQFPNGIGNLRNLRHLENRGTLRFKQFPRGLEKLTSLQTLSELKVGNSCSKLEYLRNLNQLGGTMVIQFYEIEEIDFESAKLGDKIHMSVLSLYFTRSNEYGVCTRVKEGQAPQNLQLLDLRAYPDTKLPSWIMSLHKLGKLQIEGGNITSLPALGKLPSLEQLIVEKLEGIELLGSEFMGITEITAGGVLVSFPKLKSLTFSDLGNLRIWEDLIEEDENKVACELMIMPCLGELRLESCGKLEMLPHGILRRVKSLNYLSFYDCCHLSKRYDYEASATAIETDWIHISHIPTVEIDLKTKKSSNSQSSSSPSHHFDFYKRVFFLKILHTTLFFPCRLQMWSLSNHCIARRIKNVK